ncbi:hypothetical protein [Aestuariispira ectoiniformans]|uniref:hypothetical protein n=1 Tax=Aestuariispira ectoiniformans TaxID=2775080 RepID=UPI00223AAC51|nr:hypothetical protein [Aestuariispira ectoiniformans]
MAHEDFPGQDCRDYLDLCPTTLSGAEQNSCRSPISWQRAEKLREQYSDFTIVVETLNQFAVRATRQVFREKLLDGLRFIPASLRHLNIGDFERVSELRGTVEQSGEFYRVSIMGLDANREETNTWGEIHVALVSEGG